MNLNESKGYMGGSGGKEEMIQFQKIIKAIKKSQSKKFVFMFPRVPKANRTTAVDTIGILFYFSQFLKKIPQSKLKNPSQTDH